MGGSVGDFICHREGRRLVFRPVWTSLLAPMFVTGVFLALFGLLAVLGASVVHGSWLAWHGVNEPGVTINGGLPSQAGHRMLILTAASGAGLFLFGAIPCALVLWLLGQTLRHGLRPSILDRDRGQFRIGERVVCALDDIARLHLRRGYHPDNTAEARYYARFELRDGRSAPLGLSLSAFGFRNRRETLIGKEPGGDNIEAMMQEAAAFLGVEYVLTQEPDSSLRGSE